MIHEAGTCPRRVNPNHHRREQSQCGEGKEEQRRPRDEPKEKRGGAGQYTEQQLAGEVRKTTEPTQKRPVRRVMLPELEEPVIRSSEEGVEPDSTKSWVSKAFTGDGGREKSLVIQAGMEEMEVGRRRTKGESSAGGNDRQRSWVRKSAHNRRYGAPDTTEEGPRVQEKLTDERRPQWYAKSEQEAALCNQTNLLIDRWALAEGDRKSEKVESEKALPEIVGVKTSSGYRVAEIAREDPVEKEQGPLKAHERKPGQLLGLGLTEVISPLKDLVVGLKVAGRREEKNLEPKNISKRVSKALGVRKKIVIVLSGIVVCINMRL